MLHSPVSATEKRERLRRRLATPGITVWPGAFNALSAMLIERHGYDGVYVSGAVVAADLGLPDVGLTTLSEVATRSAQIARVTALPTIVDADTGFGEPMNAARAVQVLEDAGVAGLHLEDQVNPKRCGHLDGKQVVDLDTALRRLRAAVSARRDPNLLLIARTDARAVEGLDAAVARARAYVDAGADAIFPEALLDQGEFERLRAAVTVPILANMTEFGRGATLRVDQLRDVGVNLVIFPVSLLRLAMGAANRALATLRREGTLAGVLGEMQTREELYDLLDYASFTEFDQSVFNFRSK